MLMNGPRAKKTIDDNGLHALIASTTENVTYFSDYRSQSQQYLRGKAFVVLEPNKLSDATLVVAISEAKDIIAERLSWINNIRCYGQFFVESPTENSTTAVEEEIRKLSSSVTVSDPLHLLIGVLKERGLHRGKIGIDELGFSPSEFTKLTQSLPDAEIRESSSIIRQIRMVKTEEEIKRMTMGVKILESAYETVVSVAREGMSWKELVGMFNRKVWESGGIPAGTLIAIGKQAYLRATPSKSLQSGDVVRFDPFAIYNSYYADIARTAVVGEPSAKLSKYYQAILEGEEVALKLVKPGARVSDIFSSAVEAVRKAGIPHYRRQHVGHGIGIEVYDPPVINASSQITLEEGMILNVETPYHELGFGAIAVEDTIVVTSNGFKYLSECSRELARL
jgi:Xaa-Pro aminopeptidase